MNYQRDTYQPLLIKRCTDAFADRQRQYVGEDIMLQKIMDLQVMLYCMAVLGAAGAIAMLATNLTYRRVMKNTRAIKNLKEKWLNLWKMRDKLLRRMNYLVWVPSLLCTAVLGLALFLNARLEMSRGLPLIYLYLGAAVPAVLMMLRYVLDFTYQEELIMNSLADYVEQMRGWTEEIPAAHKADPVLQEEMVERITSSIRQTAATGSHFSKMLSQEEEDIMREIIREFMQ